MILKSVHGFLCWMIKYKEQKTIRLDYQPLFGKMSPHSSPERAAGRVRFPLLV